MSNESSIVSKVWSFANEIFENKKVIKKLRDCLNF